jgi:Carboxypeptidase regulatory-like domain/Phosphoesterase family
MALMRGARSFLFSVLGPGLLLGAALGTSHIVIAAATTTPPHIMEIMEENTAYSSSDGSPFLVGNSNAPYVNNTLIANYASAVNWFSNEHISWKDYNMAIGGSDFGKKSGIGASSQTLVNELDNAGVSWKGYMESMPSACDTSSSGNYDSGHDPFVHFLAITNNTTECRNNVVPYVQSNMQSDLNSGSPPDFVWVTPNQCDDMHSNCGANPVKTGDNWLKTFIPVVMGSSWYTSGGGGIIIITWDESAVSDGASCCGDPGGGHVATIVISSASSGRFAGTGDHDGTLRAIEEAYGVGKLGGSSSSSHGDLTGAFGASLSPGTITGVVTDSSTSSAIGGATVSCTCSGTNQTTGGTGSYTFSSVPPGTYSMTFSASGYASQTISSVNVTSGSTTPENVALNVALAQPGMITGKVTDSSTSAAIVGATVSCTCSGTNQTTDGTGSYTFSSVPPGTYSMTFAASGHVSQTVSGVIVNSGSTTTESVALTPGTISPTVVQDVDKAAGAAGTSASVSPASTKAGDLLVLSVTMDAGSGNASGSITGVTDSSGTDTWTRAVADNPSTRIGAEVWYVANAPAGITLVTASFSKPVNSLLRIYEIQGAPASPLDQVHAAAGSGTTVSSGPTSTTSGSNDVLIATVGFVSTSATISGLTSGFSNDQLVRNSLTNFNNSEQAGHEIVASTGAYAYGGTLSGSQTWAAAVAAFE